MVRLLAREAAQEHTARSPRDLRPPPPVHGMSTLSLNIGMVVCPSMPY